MTTSRPMWQLRPPRLGEKSDVGRAESRWVFSRALKLFGMSDDFLLGSCAAQPLVLFRRSTVESGHRRIAVALSIMYSALYGTARIHRFIRKSRSESNVTASYYENKYKTNMEYTGLQTGRL